MMNETPFDTVVKVVGSQAKLGELVGKRQSTVSYWAKQGLIPAECAVELERATNGAVPRWVSRPDLWEEPADAKSLAPAAQIVAGMNEGAAE